MITTIENPAKETWPPLMERAKKSNADLSSLVDEIFTKVANAGDEAVIGFTQKFDKVTLTSMEVTVSEISHAIENVSAELKEAITMAKQNILNFHNAQVEKINTIETQPGVKCWRESRAINTVGVYIPGGSAPLFSTVLMVGVPAMIAGCPNVVLCTPPDKDGNIHPAILFTANLLGISKIYKVGGAQAVAAMSLGTKTIAKCDKIFGPGNQFVTAAKQHAQKFGTAIDMPAGPSEVLVIADDTADATFVASDLLAQAEHGPDSQVILLTTSKEMATKTLEALQEQLNVLPRKDIATDALKNSHIILLNTLAECIDFSNSYAPEHLIIATKDALALGAGVTNAGSVFIGNYSCESLGDYASGTNHTLPTHGYARNYSGVSVDSFVKKITFQNITESGIRQIGAAVVCMAENEGLQAHANAVTIRLNKLSDAGY